MMIKKYLIVIVALLLLKSNFCCCKKKDNSIALQETIIETINKENETAKTKIYETKKEKENEYVIKYKDDWGMLINYLLIGKSKFDELDLSDNFKSKYSKVSDIIKGNVIGTLDNTLFDEFDDKNTIVIGSKKNVTSELNAYKLRYVINDKNELDDIIIVDTKMLRDEIGKDIEYDKYVYYNDCDYACGLLVRPIRNAPTYLYVSDNFLQKFPKYPSAGVLSDVDYMIEDELYKDENDSSVCFAVVMNLEETKTYKLNVKLDDKGYVDDVNIELVDIKPTEDQQYVQDAYDENY